MAITNFEDYTANLSDKEIELAYAIAGAFKRRIGKENIISNRQICAKMKARGDHITPPRLRKIINYIRNYDLCPLLICNSKGYYVASDPEEVKDYIRSLSERAGAISSVKDSLERQLSNHCKT
ncbi:MAG: hypothetical protein H6585_09945 [Flavobacteriales bacterium]|nr:hypothetical protein [Flavobacteriales bacterium]